MPGPKKDGAGARNAAKQNGDRTGFRTDTAISNGRPTNEKVLQRWVPDAGDAVDGSLETSSKSGPWDQFAENERLFGLKTDYNENIYTTAINKNHPLYRERAANADKKAREIERSAPSTAHVAEERVMDHVAGRDNDGENEEEKYSGVRRQEFPPLNSGRENRYTPPAKRAPTGQTSVKGVPVDPAIISSQIKAPATKDAETALGAGPSVPKDAVAKPIESKPVLEERSESTPDVAITTGKVSDAKVPQKPATPTHVSDSGNRKPSPPTKDAPSATSTVERDVLNSFRSFANQQRMNAERARSTKAKADKEDKLSELKKFATSFKLSTPVPTDLVSSIAKDPAKQKEIQAKAIKNAEEVAKSKNDSSSKEPSSAAQEGPSKPSDSSSTAAPAGDGRTGRVPTAPQNSTHSGSTNRHAGNRSQYPQQSYQHQGYRNNRGGPQHMQHGGQHGQQTGGLAQRLRNMEQQKFSTPPQQTSGQHVQPPDARAPPIGPSHGNDSRRLSAVSSLAGPKLNPNSQAFRPNAFAAPFDPNGRVSNASSPRSAINQAPENIVPAPQLIRRKTKAVDVQKCHILSHIKTYKPPQGRSWDDNGGLRPSYDTLPTWRQLQDDEKADSTMHLTYKEYLDRQPFSGSSMATPNQPHAVPQMAHHHQLPLHLQQGAHHMGPRQSPHIPPLPMHGNQHGPTATHPNFSNDDHRMMHSNSQQSFASPRLGQVSVAYPGMNSPAQMPYNQPVFMGPSPQLGQYRNFSNGPHYMPPQQGPMMMQPQFMQGPQGMVTSPPQMMYHGGHPGFMPPAGPPQGAPGTNGYPSPGRPSAPMMAHQGSQQGQATYGMSPNVQYNQPTFGHNAQPGGPIPNQRGFNGPGTPHFGTSPQQGHQFGHQQRSGSSNYGNKNYPAQGQHSGPQVHHSNNQQAGPSPAQNRTDGSEENK